MHNHHHILLSVVVLCVLPRIPRLIFVFLVEGKSDGLKWCSHKVISAHMLACMAGNRP